MITLLPAQTLTHVAADNAQLTALSVTRRASECTLVDDCCTTPHDEHSAASTDTDTYGGRRRTADGAVGDEPHIHVHSYQPAAAAPLCTTNTARPPQTLTHVAVGDALLTALSVTRRASECSADDCCTTRSCPPSTQ